MTDQDKAKLRKRLKELIKKFEVEIESFEDMVKPISPENSLGRISRMDAINNKGVAEAALRQRKNKLNKMKIALLKIKEPGFGDCISCHKPIQAKRLMFMPESTKCVRCASR